MRVVGWYTDIGIDDLSTRKIVYCFYYTALTWLLQSKLLLLAGQVLDSVSLLGCRKAAYYLF